MKRFIHFLLGINERTMLLEAKLKAYDEIIKHFTFEITDKTPRQ